MKDIAYHPCRNCGEDILLARWSLGFKHCMPCGEKFARQKRHIVEIPFSKGAYQYIHNPDDLRLVNPKRNNPKDINRS
jgi:ribosomal protein L37AE/L43A